MERMDIRLGIKAKKRHEQRNPETERKKNKSINVFNAGLVENKKRK